MATNLDAALYNNDLYAQYGDMVTAESDIQHVSDTLAAFPGWWKENPPDGVGIFAYLRSGDQDQKLKRSIKINLLSDGYRADAVTVTSDANGNLKVYPNAEKL